MTKNNIAFANYSLEGKAKDLKQVAGWLNISHVRICQIMGMLLLSPEIQKEILLSTDKKIFEIPEYKVNEITKELSWTKQQEIWKDLIVKSFASPYC